MGREFKIVTSERIPNPKYDPNNPEKWRNPRTITSRVETPYVVDDGLWVAEAFVGGCLNCLNAILTLGSAAPEEVLLGSYSGGRWVLLISHEPFGVIDVLDTPEGRKAGGRHFSSARQIHKGELGQYVQIPTLRFAREAGEVAKRATKPRNNRRSHVGWALLSDLAEASGLSLEQILLGFWPFVNFRYDPESWCADFKPTMDLLAYYTRDQIHHQPPIQPRRLTRDELDKLLRSSTNLANGWGQRWDDVWVRKGFANTVLRLLALGYKPAITSPQPA